MNGTPKIACVVLNYCTPHDAIACVESLLRSVPHAEWIIVVDNASCDDSAMRFANWAAGLEIPALNPPVPYIHAEPFPKPIELLTVYDYIEAANVTTSNPNTKVFFLQSEKNLGYAAGNNIGLSLALKLGADAVWILNSDTVVAPDALGAMRERLFAQKRPGLCGSLLCFFSEPNMVQCRAGGKTNRMTMLSSMNGGGLSVEDANKETPEEIEGDLNFIYGASVMASRNFIEQVGFMYEGYFLYCEEQDWSFCSAGRFDLGYAQQARVFHKEGAIRRRKNPLHGLRDFYILAKNRLLLAWRHNMVAIPVVSIALIFVLLRKIKRTLYRAQHV